ncbi:hypothetical protein LCGC14_2424640 [marine sediment metagenome]|uniref:Uncharacterized protein n=1 Tax=marine sediment metagenome TaxID=412755 RepID=A0A0F9EHT4_9ZZZZ
MLLIPVTDSSVAGTGTATFPSRILGGLAITANGTNDATVTLQRDNSDGFTVFKLVTKSPIFVAGPISIGSQAGYYSVSGDGAAVQFYEWVE